MEEEGMSNEDVVRFLSWLVALLSQLHR